MKPLGTMRSEPLILDRETGEPKRLVPSQERYPAWKVVVVDQTTGKRKIKNHYKYKEAKAQVERLTEKFGDRIEVAVVSKIVGYGPPAKVTDRQLLELNDQGKMWCPYCRKPRDFPRSYGLRTCEFCGIWETDFHIIRCNPIKWDPRNKEKIL